MMALNRISKNVHFPVDDKLTDNTEEIKVKKVIFHG